MADPGIPIWLTEGVKKGDALASYGLCTLALLGVWGFKGKNALGGTTVLADVDAVAWNGRSVFIVFDSDVMTKPQVHKALDRLTEHLRRRGAQVRHVYLPSGSTGEKVGVDDFLVAGHTVQELEALTQAPEDEPQESLPLVREQVPDAPVSSDARVPRPYILKPDRMSIIMEKEGSNDEVEEREVPVAPAPIVITSRCQDVDSQEYDLELAWRAQEAWHRVTLRRDVAADHRKLPGAALNGLPVTSINAKAVTAYLADYECLNLDAIPKTLVTRRCGWREVDGKLGFVLGQRVIGMDTVGRLRQAAPLDISWARIPCGS